MNCKLVLITIKERIYRHIRTGIIPFSILMLTLKILKPTELIEMLDEISDYIILGILIIYYWKRPVKDFIISSLIIALVNMIWGGFISIIKIPLLLALF